MTAVTIVDCLAMLLILTSLLVILNRKLKVSAYVYALGSLFLIGIFLTMAISFEAEQLYLWSVTSLFTKTFLVPFFILRTIKATGVEEEESPILSTGWSVIAAAVLVGVAFVVADPFHNVALLKFKTVIAVSLALFLIGLLGMITRKNALKQLMGFCLMENGSHLTLAIMAYNVPELTEIGIVTDAVFGVVIMCLLAKKLHSAFGSMDTSQLKMLRG